MMIKIVMIIIIMMMNILRMRESYFDFRNGIVFTCTGICSYNLIYMIHIVHVIIPVEIFLYFTACIPFAECSC